MKVKLSFRNALYMGISFLIINLVIIFLFKNQPQISNIFSYIMLVGIYIGVTLSLYLATKATSIYGKRTQIAWLFLTFAVISSVVGSILWAVSSVYYNQNPSNSLADIFYLLFFPLFLIGILIFPSSNTTPRQRFKRYFDILIIMFSISLVLWIFFITPALQNYNGDITSLLFKITYVLGGFLLLFALLELLFSRIKPDMYAPSLLLLGGISVLIVTDCLFTYQTIHGSYVYGSPLDLGWIIGYLIIGLAGISQYNHQKINLKDIITRLSSWKKNYTFTSYFALAGVSVGYISLIWAYNTFNPNLTFIEFGIGILIFLVVSRQFLSINENKHLYLKASGRNIPKKRDF